MPWQSSGVSGEPSRSHPMKSDSKSSSPYVFDFYVKFTGPENRFQIANAQLMYILEHLITLRQSAEAIRLLQMATHALKRYACQNRLSFDKGRIKSD